MSKYSDVFVANTTYQDIQLKQFPFQLEVEHHKHGSHMNLGHPVPTLHLGEQSRRLTLLNCQASCPRPEPRRRESSPQISALQPKHTVL